MLTSLDQSLIMSLNGLVGRNHGADFILYGVTTLDLVKFVPLYALLWGLWFRDAARRDATRDARQENRRENRRVAIVAIYAAVLVTIVVSRIAQIVMPARPRPIHEPAIAFVPPDPLDPSVLEGWSSFPSDHAAIAAALAIGTLFVSRPAGLVAMGWGLFAICLPRVYSGLHYPGDILGGLVLGAAIALALRLVPVPSGLRALPLRIEARHPAWFYGLAFVLSYCLATLLDDIRTLAEGAAALLL